MTAQRLHNVAGTYTGKDDPAAIIRNQGVFPAPEEILLSFAKVHYVGGDARGSHVMPLMPVPMNTPVTGVYCLPIVSCLGFSMNVEGLFSDPHIDFFDNPAWDWVRLKAQEKALEMRAQGWSGAAMLPYTELEYSGFRDTVTDLVNQSPSATAPAPTARPAPASAPAPGASSTDTLLIATGNQGKARELAQLLADVPCRLLSLRDVGIDADVEEVAPPWRRTPPSRRGPTPA